MECVYNYWDIRHLVCRHHSFIHPFLLFFFDSNLQVYEKELFAGNFEGCISKQSSMPASQVEFNTLKYLISFVVNFSAIKKTKTAELQSSIPAKINTFKKIMNQPSFSMVIFKINFVFFLLSNNNFVLIHWIAPNWFCHWHMFPAKIMIFCPRVQLFLSLIRVFTENSHTSCMDPPITFFSTISRRTLCLCISRLSYLTWQIR